MLSEEVLYNCHEFCHQGQCRAMFFIVYFNSYYYCMYVFVWVRVHVEVRGLFWESVFYFTNSGHHEHQVSVLKLTWWCRLISPRVSIFHSLSFFIYTVRTLPFHQVAQFLACPPGSRGDVNAMAFLDRNVFMWFDECKGDGNVTLQWNDFMALGFDALFLSYQAFFLESLSTSMKKTQK